MNLKQQVAQFFIERAKAQEMRGGARDRAAIEFVVGAAASAVITHGASSPEYGELSLLAFLVATRGYVELEEVVKS